MIDVLDPDLKETSEEFWVPLFTRAFRLYIAGPMTGYPNFNERAFDETEAELLMDGYATFSPASANRRRYGAKANWSPFGQHEDTPEEFRVDRRTALALDLAYISLRADGIALLEGWENSTGAQAEFALARAIGIKAEPIDFWLLRPEARLVDDIKPV